MVVDSPVDIHLPVETSTLANFMKIQQLENTVEILGKKITAIHELVERLVEVNLQLKKQQIPTYEPEKMPTSNFGGNTSSSDSNSNSTVYLMKSSERIHIKGKTFDVKDELKSRFGAQWETNKKMWTCGIQHENELTQFFQEKGFNVEI